MLFDRYLAAYEPFHHKEIIVKRIMVFMMLTGFLLPALACAGVTEKNFELKSTQDLIDLCTVSSDDPLYHQSVNFCHGYLVGAFQYYAAAAAGPDGVKLVCFPGSVQFQNPESNLRPSDDSCRWFGGRVVFCSGVGEPPNRQGAALFNQNNDPFNHRISGKGGPKGRLEFARSGWQRLCQFQDAPFSLSLGKTYAFGELLPMLRLNFAELVLAADLHRHLERQ